MGSVNMEERARTRLGLGSLGVTIAAMVGIWQWAVLTWRRGLGLGLPWQCSQATDKADAAVSYLCVLSCKLCTHLVIPFEQ